jgi:hypothetical protein
MSSRTFFLMFEVEDGGVSNPVKWSKESLKSENIVMVLDEENMAVWLWFGAKRGLVSKRTALRQAQSLKGHGYEIGKSIVGRGLEVIHEIDERKIGRDPETDGLNDRFMEILSRPMYDSGGYVVTTRSGGEPLPMEEHFESAKPIEMEVIQPKTPDFPKPLPPPTTMPESPVSEIKPFTTTADPAQFESSSPEPFSPESYSTIEEPPSIIEESASIIETPPVVASEYSDDAAVPEPIPLTPQIDAGSMELVQKGCVIMAILSQFKDIWVSRLDDNIVSVEFMDGPIAKFHIEEGKVKFHEGAFSDIDPTVKNAIKTAFDELIGTIR